MDNQKHIEVLLDNAVMLVERCDKLDPLGQAVKDVVAAVRLLLDEVQERT